MGFRQIRAVPLRAALFVTACVFHGVPFGLAPTGFFRHCVRLVIVWLFRFCKRPNGMEVGSSLLSLWLVVAERAGFTVASVVARGIGRATSIPFGGQGRWWLARGGENECGGLCLARAGRPNGIRDSQGHVKNEKASFVMILDCFEGVCVLR